MKSLWKYRHWKLGALCAATLLGHSTGARADWVPLERIITLAKDRAAPIVDAGGQVGVAQAAGVGARLSSLQNPYMEIIADRSEFYSNSTRTLPTPKVQVISQIWIPFEVAGQRSARIDEANRLLEWRRLGLVSARAQILGEALVAYGQTVIAAIRLAESVKATESARAEAEYFAGRLGAGDATLYDQKLAEAELARWAQTRTEVRYRLNSGLNRLTQLTGLRSVDPPPPDVDHKTPGLRVSWDDAAVARAVERAPIVAGLRAEQKYWSAAQERAEREKSPPVSLILHAGRGEQAEPKLGAGLAWTFPILRRNQGEIARTGAEHTRATNLETTNRHVIDARIRGALLAYSTLSEALALAEQSAIPAAEGVLSAAEESFRAGKAEILRVLIARRDLATARFRRLDVLEAMWTAYGELAALNGGLP